MNYAHICSSVIEGNGGYSFGDIAQKRFHGDFHMPSVQRTFLKAFQIMNDV